MGIDHKALAGLVTFHAVTRYVQRVLGVDAEMGGRAKDEAARHCLAAGLTIAEVQELIMVPQVVVACIHKMNVARTPLFTAFLSPSGAVLTVTEPFRRHAVKNKGRSEGRRENHQRNRRQKRRGAMQH